MPKKYDVSEGRKVLYYGGMVLTGIGFVLFISTFFTVIGGMGRAHMGLGFGFGSGPSVMLRPVIGMILMIAGSAMRTVGARGLAGSGLVLSPQKAREDLAPWARMAGGLVDDALSEVESLQDQKTPASEQVVVKVRCRECGTLNRETAKFCNECGKPL